jgi:hypothetical protein
MKFQRALLAAAASLAVCAPAFAAFPDDCSVTDLSPNATACAGVFTNNGGNNLGAGNTAIADLTASFGDLGWSLSVAELPFSGDTSGTITIDPAVSGPFAIALKAGSATSDAGYSLYYFDGSFTDIGSLDYSGTPAGKGLSHASLYVGAIPEPGTWALMLAGMVGIAGMSRRRRA